MLFNLDRYNATKTVNQTIFYNETHIDQRPMIKTICANFKINFDFSVYILYSGE